MKPEASNDNRKHQIDAAVPDNSRADKIRSGECPMCRTPTKPSYRPFCSKRCADIDLGRWLNGRYIIPGNPETEEDENPAAHEPAATSNPEETPG